MSPICPRCGGELKEVVIFAWKHLYADMEENCGGKDGATGPRTPTVLPAENVAVPANPAQQLPSGYGTPPILRREYFTCPRCGNKKEWFLRERHPWRGAVCRDCYAAELTWRQVELEKQDAREAQLAGGER